MASKTPGSDFWSYAPPVARLQCGLLTAEVDVQQPQLGLQHLSWQAKPLAVQALGVCWKADAGSPTASREPRWPMQTAEAYVRAGDLVATYLTEPAWPYRPQIYWRAGTLDGISQVRASLSLVVSMQTDLLDTRPQLNVISQLAAEELLHVAVSEHDHSAQSLGAKKLQILESGVGIHCIVLRLPGGETSYMEWVPAPDFQQAWFTPAGEAAAEATLEWQLFNEFLEKGVIRRARVHMALLPRENDVQLAAECCRALATRPLPLTT